MFAKKDTINSDYRKITQAQNQKLQAKNDQDSR
jgi:hypothetical protein